MQSWQQGKTLQNIQKQLNQLAAAQDGKGGHAEGGYKSKAKGKGKGHKGGKGGSKGAVAGKGGDMRGKHVIVAATMAMLHTSV